MALYHNPDLSSSYNQKPEESENSSDILNNPFLTSPNSQGRNQASPTPASSLTPPDSSYQTKTLISQRDNSCWGKSYLSACYQGSIWALSGLNFSYESMTTEKKRFFFFFYIVRLQYSLDSRGNFALKLQNLLFFASAIRES